MARPTSALRIALAAELIDGPGTCKELYRRMGCEWPLADVRTCLANMVAAGDVWNDQRVRVPGVRRPVPVYERALLDDDDSITAPASLQGGAGVHDLIACWAGLVPRLAPATTSEAAM